jgi:excisionase family DNA binding protein
VRGCCAMRPYRNPPIMSAGPKQQRRRSKRARNPNRRSIKTHRNYTVEEAARATGCAKGTIRRWIKSGALPAVTDRKPNLILGGDLFDYLKARATSGPKLRLNECYCLKCRAPREPALGMADYVPLTPTTGNLRALCSTCTTIMHKAVPLAAVAALAGILDVTVQQASKHISDIVKPSLNDHLAREPETHA